MGPLEPPRDRSREPCYPNGSNRLGRDAQHEQFPELPWRRTTNGRPQTLRTVIAWSLEEPQRIGEVASIPRHGGIWGVAATRRTTHRSSGSSPVIAPRRWNPRRRSRARVSRHQLLLMPVEGGELDGESPGAALSVNGVPVTKARVKPGDTLTLRNALILLVAPRQASPAAGAPSARTFPFGQQRYTASSVRAPRPGSSGTRSSSPPRRDEHVLPAFGESGAGRQGASAARALHALSGRLRRDDVSQRGHAAGQPGRRRALR